LLLKQSIEKRVFGSVITPLTLSGDYCDLGQFRDLVHDHDKSRAVTYSFRIPLAMINSYQREEHTAILQLGRSENSWSDWLQFIARDLNKLKDEVVEISLTFSEDEPYGPSLSRCEIMVGSVGKVRFVRTIKGERKPHWRTYAFRTPVFRDLGLEPSPGRFFPELTSRRWRRNTGKVKWDKRLIQFHRAGHFCFQFLEDLLRSSEMIGPFRQPPERRYTFSGFGTNKIGPNGEQAVDQLITELLVRKGSAQPLIAAVGYWLKELKLADSLKVKDAARKLNLFELDIRLEGARLHTNLVDVGFGISQVLPVIVQGLLMKRGGIYIVQEPEIHLHPDAQASLADFFIYLACQGVTCIVETHSEYLLLRLRRRLAEGRGPLSKALPKLMGPMKSLTENEVSVLVSEKLGSQAVIRRLEIGKEFQFEKMPQGFMTQATEDRIQLLRAASKRNG
jgi:hypothetical protein